LISELNILKSAEKEFILDKLIPNENSLWYQLKILQNQNRENKNPYLIVFDQFEELFTYPKAQVIEFCEQLANILRVSIPANFSKKLQEVLKTDRNSIPKEEFAFINRALQVKVVFAIRSDRMSLLNEMTPYIPDVLHNCFELKPLNIQQAKDAMLEPAKIVSTDFSTPVFSFETSALDKIIDNLKDDKQNIESFQLQIICQYCENLIEQRFKQNPNSQFTILQTDILDIKNILETFYTSIIDNLNYENQADKKNVYKVLGEDFIFEKEQRRILVYEGRAIDRLGTSLLKQLTDSFIIRSEKNSSGGFVYELSHDTTVAPILKAYIKLREEEQKRIAEEKRLEEERKQRERIKRQRTIIAIVSVAACIAVLLAIFGLRQMNKANKALTEVEKKKTELDSTLKIVEQAKAEAVASESKALLAKEEAENAQNEAVAEKETAVKATNLAQILLGKSRLLLQSFLPGGLDENSVYTYFNAKGDSLIKAGDYAQAIQNFNLAKNAPNLPQNSNIETKLKNAQNCNIWQTEAYNLLWKQNYDKAEELIQKVLEINPEGKYSKIIASAIDPVYAMVYVEGGTFAMGCDSAYDECNSDEYLHNVKLTSYEIGQYEVTNLQYAIFLNKYGCGSEGEVLEGEFTGNTMIYEHSWGVYFDETLQIWKPQTGYDYFPVENVTWYGANEYCSYYGGSLPTEEQWEYAARGGNQTYGVFGNPVGLIYSGSNSIDEVAWYSDNSKSQTHEVGTKLSNQLGIYDMSGNVWEWNSDWYKGYEGSSGVSDYTNSGRVYRGGSWNYYARHCRFAFRYDDFPNRNYNNLGFRVVFVF